MFNFPQWQIEHNPSKCFHVDIYTLAFFQISATCPRQHLGDGFIYVHFFKVYILFFFKFFNVLFVYYVYFWLCRVFVSVRGLSPVVASRGHSSSRCVGLSLSRPLLLRSTCSRRAGSVVVAHGPSCSAACGIFPDQDSNPCALHRQADSQPLRHQGSPFIFVVMIIWLASVFPTRLWAQGSQGLILFQLIIVSLAQSTVLSSVNIQKHMNEWTEEWTTGKHFSTAF